MEADGNVVVVSPDGRRLTTETLRYDNATNTIMTDKPFSVDRGETIAFVGPSGAGKTTLVKLLVGLYPPKTGRILYDGHPSTRVDLDRMRERIGFVTQDTQLFSGSIRENLLFVRPDATDEECLAALHQACEDTVPDGGPLPLHLELMHSAIGDLMRAIVFGLDSAPQSGVV